jgi:hypothetical protein
VTPILSTADFAAAVDRYRRLGVDANDDEPHVQGASATRDGIEVHLSPCSLDQNTSNVAVYVVVDDPDALYREWRDAGVAGRPRAPQETGRPPSPVGPPQPPDAVESPCLERSETPTTRLQPLNPAPDRCLDTRTSVSRIAAVLPDLR